MRKRKSEAEIIEMQKKWGNKPCNHDRGYGIEWNYELGCETDFYCLECGFQCYSSKFFDERERQRLSSSNS